MTTKLEQAARQAFSFCEEISSFLGKYPYVNGTEIVADARQVSASLREALDHSADAGKMIGCAYCNNPLFAGTKCNNCGRVTLAEQAEQEIIPSWEEYCECEGIPCEPVKPVNLTDEEINELWLTHGQGQMMYIHEKFARAVIAADREKNK